MIDKEGNLTYKKYIGNTQDHLCKANIIRLIDRQICRNNCKYWDNIKKKCMRGY